MIEWIMMSFGVAVLAMQLVTIVSILGTIVSMLLDKEK